MKVALPEMMALANLLHHPRVAPQLIEDSAGWKRSNKDLGRVVALAWLAMQHDRRGGTDDFERWAPNMVNALQECFGAQARELAGRLGDGLREMLSSPGDRDQALRICNLGLLAGQNVGLDAFAAMGARVLADVIEPVQRVL